MSKSVRQQIMDGKIEVNYKNETKIVNLPKWMQEVAENLDNPDQLTTVLRNHGVLLGVLHKGLDNCIQTGVRSVCRKTSKTENGQEHWIDPTAGENYKPSPLPEDKEKESAKKTIEKLKEKGYSKQEILEMLED